MGSPVTEKSAIGFVGGHLLPMSGRHGDELSILTGYNDFDYPPKNGLECTDHRYDKHAASLREALIVGCKLYSNYLTCDATPPDLDSNNPAFWDAIRQQY